MNWRTFVVSSTESGARSCSNRLWQGTRYQQRRHHTLLNHRLQARDTDQSQRCLCTKVSQGKKSSKVGRIYSTVHRTFGWDGVALEGVFEHMSATKVDDLHDPLVANNHVVQLQIAVRKTQAVKIGHTVENLQKATG